MGGQPAAVCARVLKRVVTGAGALERGGGGGARTGDVEVLADGGAEVRRDGVQEAGAPHHDGAGPARTVCGPPRMFIRTPRNSFHKGVLQQSQLLGF